MLRLVAGWQWVDMGIVEQGMVAVSPWEPLGTDAKVLVWDEFWRLMRVPCHLQVGVQHAETNSWEGDEEGQVAPQFPAAT